MNKFKVDDIVKCEWGYHSRIEIGKTYKVKEVSAMAGSILITTPTGDNWYNVKYFKSVSPEFDMKTNPWVIYVNNEQLEYNAVIEFLRNKGFYIEPCQETYDGDVCSVTNVYTTGEIVGDNKILRLFSLNTKTVGAQEIKIEFEHRVEIKSVSYPEVRSKKDIEIDKIQNEMKQLAERLDKLKGENDE